MNAEAKNIYPDDVFLKELIRKEVLIRICPQLLLMLLPHCLDEQGKKLGALCVADAMSLFP